MIGREYIWRGRRWRVVCRWGTTRIASGQVETLVCVGDAEELDGCGRILVVRDEDERPYTCNCAAAEALTQWHPLNTSWRTLRGGPRNVLIEDVETGERVVRPFRGLRKPQLRLEAA